MKSTAGEFFVAFLVSAVLAVLAAVAGFFAGALLPAILLSGESGEWGLVLAPAMALLSGGVVFVFAFRKIRSYGEGPENPS
jgi:uncharacterized RDD family membrane protein YckC